MNPTRGIVLAFALALLALAACDESTSDCENYCNQEENCAKASDTMYSESQCRRSCTEESERYASVGCDYQYGVYLFCMKNLSCTLWDQQTENCAESISALSKCVSGKS